MLKTIRGWLRPKPQPRQLIPEGYTLEDWRSNRELPSQFKRVLEEPVMRRAISVMFQHLPTGYPIRGEAINEIQAAVELGRINGYTECLSLFQSLAQSPASTEQIEPTYGSDNPDTWQ